MKKILVISSNPGRATPTVNMFIDKGHTVTSVWSTVPSADWDKSKLRPEVRIVEIAKKIDENEAVERALAESPDLIAVVGLTSLLPGKLLELPKFGVINTHAGKLPKYRGGSPLNWQIIKGEPRIGISVIRLTHTIDGGPILAEADFALESSDDIATVHEKTNQLFPSLFAEVLAKIEAGSLIERPQSEEGAGYWHQRQRGDGKLDWSALTAVEAHNFVRALTRPYPGAFCFNGEKEVGVLRTEIPKERIHGTAGRVLFLQGEGPYVICKDLALKITEYQTVDGTKLRHGDQLS